MSVVMEESITTKSTSTPIAWLRDLPEHWAIARGKAMFYKVQRDVRPEDEVITAFRDGEVTLRKNRRKIGFTESLKEIGYQGIRKGDLVIHAMDGFAGAIGVSDSDGKSSPVYQVCLPRTEDTNPHYYAFLLREMARSEYILALATGIRERSTDFRFDDFATQLYPKPPREEQDAIVAFLDRKLEEIDRFIANKRRLIELLEEERLRDLHRIITHSVSEEHGREETNNPCFPAIPKGWKFCRVKHAAKRISKGDTPSNFGRDFDPSGEVRFIKIENIGDGQIIESPMHRIDQETHNMLKRSHLQVDDLVYAISGATTGKVAKIEEQHLPANTNQAVAYIRPNGMVSADFLSLWLRSPKLKEFMWLNTVQSAQPNLSMEELGNLPLAVPPPAEQELIVTRALAASAANLQAISNARREIELMEEFRTSLIAEAVTGKIDVRGHA